MPEKNIIRITPEDITNSEPTSPPSELSSFDWSQLDSVSVGKEPVDVMLVIDTSGSMGATDYAPNRLEAAKEAARLFTRRKVIRNYHDRVGVIGFGGNAILFHRLDSDLEKVGKAIDRLQITHSGTMIGTALKTAATELQRAKGASKQAIILLSDGGDEYDTSRPVEVARSLSGIKIFTIGMGTVKGGMAKLPHGKQKVFLNEKLLKEIAKAGGGEYLYAPDVFALQRIYRKLADY